MRLSWGPLRLSASALATVLRAQRIGEPHIALADTAVWYPPDERQQADEEAWAEFAEQGLTEGAGRLTEQVLDWLPALSRPPVEYYAWITAGEETVAFLVAPVGRHAVLATRRDDEIKVAGIDGDNPAETLIQQLPAATTPRATSINVRRSDLPGHGTAATGGMVVGRAGSADAQRFVRMAQQPATGLGELYVAVRDHLGRRHAMPEPVRYRDIAGERWMINTDGDYITVVPATPVLFAEVLHEARHKLGR